MESLRFDYSCDKCGDHQTNLSLTSFACDCGGSYRISDGIKTDIFEPYYDETLKKRITSARQRNYEFRKAGLYVSQDNYKQVRHWKEIRENKEEFHQELMRKEGKSYKPGSGERWDENKQDFVGGKRSKPTYFCPR